MKTNLKNIIMKNLSIYDNNGKSFDRITVIFNDTKQISAFGSVCYEAIGSSETGEGFYQHTMAEKGRHLGKKIKFSDLKIELQKRLLTEINS